jgi:8-oxo-dGTP pyrophosphatase MutT (NUDIX family)
MLRKKVQIVVFDLSGETPMVLLLKTRKSRGSFWQNITGSVNPKEALDSAAKRELFEETGLTPDEFLDLGYSFEFGDFIEHTFAAILNKSPKKIKIDPKEHDDFKWVEAQKISKSDYKFQSNFESFIIANMRIKI